jgi:hypothetical protein
MHTSVINFFHIGSSISIRGINSRTGKDTVSLYNMLTLGSSISTRNTSRFGSSVSLFDALALGSSISIRS